MRTGLPRRSGDVLPATRLAALVILPVLLTAFVLLFGFPGHTDRLWAWTIHPDMTALAMGGGYLSGGYFFLRTATARSWRRVAVGFRATVPFTALLLLATVLHWSRFHHHHVSFWMWLLLYAVTPFLLPVLYVLNNRAAAPEVRAGPVVPTAVRYLVGGIGAVQLLAALVIFVHPQVVIAQAPWRLTPLTARTLSAFAVFLAVVWLSFLAEKRWDALEVPAQATLLGLLAVAVAAGLARKDFHHAAGTVVFAATVATLLVTVTTMCVLMARARPTSST